MVTGYDGYLSLEVFNDEFRGGSTKRFAVDGHRSLQYIMDTAAAGAPSAKLPTYPAKPALERVEFIEFCVDGSDEVQMGRPAHVPRLHAQWRAQVEGGHALHAGRHQHCPQRRARRLRAFLQLGARHGGMRHRTARRRCAKGDAAAPKHSRRRRSSSRSGEGELELPAIRGVGGSLIYFIEPKGDLGRVWEIEFSTVDDAPATTAAGLTAIDHVSQSMLYEEMLSWILFYRSILDLEPLAHVDVFDPGTGSTARSCNRRTGRCASRSMRPTRAIL